MKLAGNEYLTSMVDDSSVDGSCKGEPLVGGGQVRAGGSAEL